MLRKDSLYCAMLTDLQTWPGPIAICQWYFYKIIIDRAHSRSTSDWMLEGIWVWDRADEGLMWHQLRDRWMQGIALTSSMIRFRTINNVTQEQHQHQGITHFCHRGNHVHMVSPQMKSPQKSRSVLTLWLHCRVRGQKHSPRSFHGTSPAKSFDYVPSPMEEETNQLLKGW